MPHYYGIVCSRNRQLLYHKLQYGRLVAQPSASMDKGVRYANMSFAYQMLNVIGQMSTLNFKNNVCWQLLTKHVKYKYNK